MTVNDGAIIAGTKIGPYEVQSQLGRGGMGVVYLATNIRLEAISPEPSIPLLYEGGEVLNGRSIPPHRRERRTADLLVMIEPLADQVGNLDRTKQQTWLGAFGQLGIDLRRQPQRRFSIHTDRPTNGLAGLTVVDPVPPASRINTDATDASTPALQAR
jgi:serine/threonine protein kinase